MVQPHRNHRHLGLSGNDLEALAQAKQGAGACHGSLREQADDLPGTQALDGEAHAVPGRGPDEMGIAPK